MTAADVKLSIKHLDPVAAGFVDASAGISMLADVEAHAVSDGVTVTSDGTVHAERLVILKGGSAAPKPVDLSYNVSYLLKDSRGQVQDLALKTGAVAAHVSGAYDLSGVDPIVDLKMVGKALPIDDLQALLPAAGVRLPNGSVLRGGTLTTTLAITGAIKDSVIAGPDRAERYAFGRVRSWIEGRRYRGAGRSEDGGYDFDSDSTDERPCNQCGSGGE